MTEVMDESRETFQHPSEHSPFYVDDAWLRETVEPIQRFYAVEGLNDDQGAEPEDMLDNFSRHQKRAIDPSLRKSLEGMIKAGTRFICYADDHEVAKATVAGRLDSFFGAWPEDLGLGEVAQGLRGDMFDEAQNLQISYQASLELRESIHEAATDSGVNVQYEIVKLLAGARIASESGNKNAPRVVMSRMLVLAEHQSDTMPLILLLRQKLEEGSYTHLIAQDLLQSAVDDEQDPDAASRKLRNLIALIVECGDQPDRAKVIEQLAANGSLWPSEAQFILKNAQQSLANSLLLVHKQAEDDLAKYGSLVGVRSDEQEFQRHLTNFMKGFVDKAARTALPGNRRVRGALLRSQAQAQRQAANVTETAAVVEQAPVPKPLICFDTSGQMHGQESEVFQAMITEYIKPYNSSELLKTDLENALASLAQVEASPIKRGVKVYKNHLHGIGDKDYQIYGFKPDDVPTKRPTTPLGKRIRILFGRIEGNIAIFSINDRATLNAKRKR